MGAYLLHPEKRSLFRAAVVAAVTLLSLHLVLYRQSGSSYPWATIPLQTHVHTTADGVVHPSPTNLSDSANALSELEPTNLSYELEPSSKPITPKPISTPQDKNNKIITTTPFPKKLWQTSKHGFVSLEAETKETVASWLKLNSDWRYEVLSDSSAETYVRTTFASRPDLTSTYFSISDPILRADMLRYLVLLGDGGVYSDTDTRCLRPISSWIPSMYEAATNVVVGIEYDRMDGGRWFDWTLDLQFTNWAIMAKPGHPVLDLTLRRLSEAVTSEAHHRNVPVSQLQLSQHEILNATGPARFTMGVFEYLRERMGGAGGAGEEEFGWRNVSRLRRPVLVEDVLILPINGFGSGQPHSNSGKAEDEDSLVQHLFKGSWKQDRPMIGEKEESEEKARKEKEESEEKARKEKEEEERKQKERKQKEEIEKKAQEAKEKELAAKAAEEKKQREEAERKDAEAARLLAEQAKEAQGNQDATMMGKAAVKENSINNNNNNNPQTLPTDGSQSPDQISGSGGNEVRDDNVNLVAG